MSIERRLEKLERQAGGSGHVEEMTDEQLERAIGICRGSLLRHGQTDSELREWLQSEHPDLVPIFDEHVRDNAEH